MSYEIRAKEWITDHDVKQKKLAETFQITEAMLSNYLTGRNEMPVEILVKLARYFHITVDYLVGLSDEPQPPMRLREGEEKLVEDFRTLSREQKELILKNVHFMQEQNQR